MVVTLLSKRAPGRRRTSAAASLERSATALKRFADWLQRRNRIVTIALGVVFGTWFLVKALSGLGLI